MGQLPEVLTRGGVNEKGVDYRNALVGLTEDEIDQDSAHVITAIYNGTNQQYYRNLCLKLLYNKPYRFLHDFFAKAYQRERYLDMKLLALRGLAQFAEEQEIAKLLKQFNVSLRKRAETTPCNYHEYELLLAENAMPYLVDTYGYACFQETLAIMLAQYKSMPDAFKGHFTVDANGNVVLLRSPEKTRDMISSYFGKNK